MNYHLHVNGTNVGTFGLDELRHRRATGELNGTELVWREGMPNWQSLDSILAQGAQPPPLPLSAQPMSSGTKALVITGICLGAIVLLAFIGFLGFAFVKGFKQGRAIAQQRRSQISQDTTPQSSDPSDPGPLDSTQEQGVAAASQPIKWTTNTLTGADMLKKQKAFRVRQYLDGYKERGDRQKACDADSITLIEGWINTKYGGADANTNINLPQLADKLANQPGCSDPIVLTVCAVECEEMHEEALRCERALNSFALSKHKAYPRFYTTLVLANTFNELGGKTNRVAQLDEDALQLLKKSLTDGSITPEDQDDLASTLLDNWGYRFNDAKSEQVISIVEKAGPRFHWLALVLNGQAEVDKAWAARGGGYSDTVTKEGWKGFSDHLSAARDHFTEAWQLHPEFPLAASRMVYVSLGDTGLGDMRLWFDRALAAQIDNSTAWTKMRWGLRPRWYGSYPALHALGVAAVNTGRFDTDVPRQYFEAISDIESELTLPPGQHIYGRDDVWPHFQRLYEGYIAEPSQEKSIDGWRTSYLAVSYFAGKYDISRKVLEDLDWKPIDGINNWNKDLSLLPLEVAARTGSLSKEITAAEVEHEHNITKALKLYHNLAKSTGADERTRQFIQHRIVALEFEKRLQSGEWVDFLPASSEDPNWTVYNGTIKSISKDGVEVESGPQGHLLVCRARVGLNFEVTGEFDVVHSSTHSFQAGIVMGLPHPSNYDWYGFRVKRNDNEGDVINFAGTWEAGGYSRQLPLNSDHNSFTFTFQNVRATATVNGTPLLTNVERPRGITVADTDFLVGLGAFNDMNETIIRYKNVKVRRLKTQNTASR